METTTTTDTPTKQPKQVITLPTNLRVAVSKEALPVAVAGRQAAPTPQYVKEAVANAHANRTKVFQIAGIPDAAVATKILRLMAKEAGEQCSFRSAYDAETKTLRFQAVDKITRERKQPAANAATNG